MPELRILIADDHEMVRRGVRTLLEAEPGWKVVAEVSDGQQAIDRVADLKPEIVLLDISMPRLSIEELHLAQPLLGFRLGLVRPA